MLYGRSGKHGKKGLRLRRFQKNNHPKRATVAAARYAPCGDGHGDARLRILGQFKFWKFLTQDWWENHRTDFDLFVSQLVIQEARAGDKQAAQQRFQVLEDLSLLQL